MKMTTMLTALLLCCSAAPGIADNRSLPLHKRISVEKLILVENYQNGMQKCRARSNKSARLSCIEQRKNLFDKTVKDLESDPVAYFAAKERNALTDKTSPTPSRSTRRQ